MRHEHAGPTTPSWVRRMTPGRWYRISGDLPDLGLPATAPGTRYLADNDPAKDVKLNPARGPKEVLRRLLGRHPHSPWQGRVGFPAITEAWNGAVFASRFGASGSMVLFGGGHDDYFGSDVHAFDLSTRQWSRISDGYVSGGADEYGAGAVYPEAVYPDGSPLPPHTYGYVQYDTIGNDYLLLKGQTELGPGVKAAPIPHMFNLNLLKWRRGPKHPSAILSSGGWTAWDASRRILWGHSGDNGNAFIGFSPDGDNGDGTFGSWTTLYPKKIQTRADHNAMAMDPVRDIIVMVASAFNALFAIDPSEPRRQAARLSSEGDRPVISEYAALEYAPNLDRFVYYSANDGPQIYSIASPAGSTWPQLVPGPWTWRSLLKEGNRLDPVTQAAGLSSYGVNVSHTFGRFRVATHGQTDVAILVRHTDTPVYAMRLN
jgi:Galactose oxidase, central domain